MTISKRELPKRPRTLLNLTLPLLQIESARFSEIESVHDEPSIYGTTDGKAIGTYLEHKFQNALNLKYTYEQGSSAKGIDFPGLGVDMKVTSVKQPQSSCPFRSARQKIYGLGYSILLFVYEKSDNDDTRSARLNILHTAFIHSHRTADYQTSRGILEILNCDGNTDDLFAFIKDRNLPVDDIQASGLVEEIIGNPPQLGYLTISNAQQWRLQYKRIIDVAGDVEGVTLVR